MVFPKELCWDLCIPYIHQWCLYLFPSCLIPSLCRSYIYFPFEQKHIYSVEQKLNNDLELYCMKANKLTLHVEKSNLPLLKMNKNQKNKNMNVCLGQDKLRLKEYPKYLGVYTDS